MRVVVVHCQIEALSRCDGRRHLGTALSRQSLRRMARREGRTRALIGCRRGANRRLSFATDPRQLHNQNDAAKTQETIMGEKKKFEEGAHRPKNATQKRASFLRCKN